jgi:hypothetical protein
MALMSPMRPEDQVALMQAPASPDFAAVQHPMHAIMAPIGPPPPEITPDVAMGMSPEGASIPSAVEPKKPKVTTMSPLERFEEKQGQKLMSDMDKDANPYGSPNNHPGFFGKFLHGLSVATGGPNRRAFEEQGIARGLNENENELSKRGLEGAQTEQATANAGHLNAETPEVAPNAESERKLQGAQADNLGSETKERDQLTAQGPPLANAYAHRVNQVLAAGGDPSTDPVAQHLADAITSLQKQAADSKGVITDLKRGGQEHNVLVNPVTGEEIKDLGLKGEKPMQVNVNAGRAERNDLLKAYQPTLDSAERFNVMTESYEKAVKDHDQQAMLNLLANHLGMTMGLQKGARLTKDIIHEAQQSQPWLAGIKSHFDNDGYLAGVTLSPNQMRQMVALGQERYTEDTKKSRATAQYLGAHDDGPQRVPGKATINFYLGKAGGDPARAKQLAAQDGWSVQ